MSETEKTLEGNAKRLEMKEDYIRELKDISVN